jgi:hypothetical protein
MYHYIMMMCDVPYMLS